MDFVGSGALGAVKRDVAFIESGGIFHLFSHFCLFKTKNTSVNSLNV